VGRPNLGFKLKAIKEGLEENKNVEKPIKNTSLFPFVISIND
jgi:hypothetical protein